MTLDEQQILQDFETRVRQLMLDYRQLRAENRSLQRLVEDQQAQIEDIKTQNLNLKRDLSALRMAHLVRMEEDDIKQARAKINQMVREVDKCIALLGA